jgi:hypothetical protein
MYNLSNLSHFDFEILIRDLLQAEFGVRFQSFKRGKDLGIDAMASVHSDGDTIVQCKHWAESGYKALLGELQKEAPKMLKVNPKRYILATSVALLPQYKFHIQELFAPVPLSTDDIIGVEDIQNLLERHPQVLRQHYKLWLSSVHVLERILHGRIYEQTDQAIQEMLDRSKYYVQNSKFAEAMKILDETHSCIITGDPGIGKSTLAEMLVLAHLERDFEIINIIADPSEVSAIDNDKNPKFIYYDDFLGQTSLDEKLPKGEDVSLLSLVRSVKSSSEKRFLLTTRDYILHQTKDTHTKLKREFDVKQCVLSLSDYSRFEKAHILYNHLYFSGIRREYLEDLLFEDRYFEIIDHSNYNPRLMEAMTKDFKEQPLMDGSYFKTFVANLDNPSRVWSDAFLNHLSDLQRDVLLLLVTFRQGASLSEFRELFRKFGLFRLKEFGISRSPFELEKALKQLEGNFISTGGGYSEPRLRYKNPSIKDFIINYILDNEWVLQDLIRGVSVFDNLRALSEIGVRGRESEIIIRIKKHRLEFLGKLRDALYEGDGVTITRLHYFLRTHEKIVGKLPTDLASHLDTLFFKLEDSHVDIEDLISLLEFITAGKPPLSQEIRAQFRGVIINHDFEFQDFAAIRNYLFELDFIFSEVDAQDLVNRFENYIRNEFPYEYKHESDIDVLESLKDELEVTSQAFGFDDFYYVRDQIAEKIEESREEKKVSEFRNWYSSDSTISSQTPSESEEIRRLFQKLN